MPKNEITQEKLKQGLKVKEYYETLGVSQVFFAEKLNITRQLLSNIVNGWLPIHSIMQGLSLLGCNLDWVITEEGDKFNENETGIELKNAPANAFIIKDILNRASEKIKKLSEENKENSEADFEESLGTNSEASIQKQIESKQKEMKKLFEERLSPEPAAAGELKKGKRK